MTNFTKYSYTNTKIYTLTFFRYLPLSLLRNMLLKQSKPEKSKREIIYFVSPLSG